MPALVHTAAPAEWNRRHPGHNQPSHPIMPRPASSRRLVLTQIHFLKGMRGRLGSTNERTQVEPNWYEFFGDIELGRAKVHTTKIRLNFDKLPPDGMFLTGQTLQCQDRAPSCRLARINSGSRLR